MFLLKLALKSLKNRAFTSFLAISSVALSVFLLLGVEKLRSGAKESFGNALSKTDLVVGARGSPVQLLLYSVFHIGDATNNLSFKTFQDIKNNEAVEWVIPLSMGDSHKGHRVIATDESFYEHVRFQIDKQVEFSQGRAPQGIFDVAIGAEVAQKLKYKVGDKITLSHGVSSSIMDHADKPFEIVGVFKKTGTPIDRALYITLYGMEALHMDWKHGAPPMPGEEIHAEDIHQEHIEITQITSFLLRAKSRLAVLQLQRQINQYSEEAIMAVIPGVTLMKLWDQLGYVENALTLISFLVLLVALLGILISVYTTLNERRREMAILRVLGLGPIKIAALFVLEALLLSLLGLIFGIALLYSLLYLLQPWVAAEFSTYINIQAPSKIEYTYMMIILLGTFVVGLLPALKAYKNALSDALSIKV